MNLNIRSLLPSDESFLRKALHVALWDAPDEPRRPLTVLDDRRISALVADWGRPGDVGFLAEAQNDREQLGAVWIRSYTTPPMGEEFLDRSIPHLGIAVLDSFQRMGIGTAPRETSLDRACLSTSKCFTIASVDTRRWITSVLTSMK
jgi:GNAT superfamily N-acetyltransferase